MNPTFEESVKIIREKMREGDAKAVADSIGCSKPVIFNALQKPSLAEMTMMEKKAFEGLLELLTKRIKSEQQTTDLAINLAAALSK